MDMVDNERSYEEATCVGKWRSGIGKCKRKPYTSGHTEGGLLCIATSSANLLRFVM